MGVPREQVLALLPRFRAHLLLRSHREERQPRSWLTEPFGEFLRTFPTPTRNIHAVGMGLRRKNGQFAEDTVLKVYVHCKLPREAFSSDEDLLPAEFYGCGVDIVELRRQRAQGSPAHERQRPVRGGLSVSPLGAPEAGTLACFLRPIGESAGEFYALSANHVLCELNQLPPATKIVQPGPSPSSPTSPADIFAELTGFVPVRFIEDGPQDNRFDAAWARVTQPEAIEIGHLFPEVPYDPSNFATPEENLDVVKVGAESGLTRGKIVSVHVNGIQVEFGSPQGTRQAVFDDTFQVVSPGDGDPFSKPGDSGALILEQATGHPVGLLFSGDGYHTTACDFGALCQILKMVPA